ncbi:peptidylprolyl isomerase [Reichenbachiella faecimaris]|uniref:Peptidyl-prolyl cis-trans isomerase n=1 Tax=Reichenbachiella faecimaris TaxID=692418 RepID=A0A1W2GAT9_REIFA|nr:FKBP-type peptidyl-prolyl cis-trans isomerase [Reichenbachiella faecimaris]SMD33777.1 peptidylprolyl isomerase [Reichenbachiella faecimaris]
MKKELLYLFVMLLFFTSCKDDENKSSLLSYLKKNNITDYNTTSSGLIYIIDEQGEGLLPEIGDTVQVEYTGYFTNDEIFDSSVGGSPLEFVLGLGQVVPGWDEGIGLYNQGGSGTLYVPAKLAYGSDDMIFEITLEKVALGIAGYTIADYIEENNDWEDYSVTQSGIHYRITESVPEADSPTNGNTVTVNYTGYYLNNKIFDTSVGKSSFSFDLGTSNIIEGFNEAVSLLKVGEAGDFLIPSDLAYGEDGVAGVFTPNQNIRFTIKLVSFQ